MAEAKQTEWRRCEFHLVMSIACSWFLGHFPDSSMADRIPDLLRPTDKTPVDAQLVKVDGRGEGVGTGRETMTIRDQGGEVSLIARRAIHVLTLSS